MLNWRTFCYIISTMRHIIHHLGLIALLLFSTYRFSIPTFDLLYAIISRSAFLPLILVSALVLSKYIYIGSHGVNWHDILAPPRWFERILLISSILFSIPLLLITAGFLALAYTGNYTVDNMPPYEFMIYHSARPFFNGATILFLILGIYYCVTRILHSEK